MALSQADLDDARRFCGYPVGPALQWMDTDTQQWSANLDAILAALTDNQASIVQNTYLVPLRTLETDIANAAQNLDTDQAAVWHHNKQEIQDRETLYMLTRRKLTFFLGVPAGAGIVPLAPAVLIV